MRRRWDSEALFYRRDEQGEHPPASTGPPRIRPLPAAVVGGAVQALDVEGGVEGFVDGVGRVDAALPPAAFAGE